MRRESIRHDVFWRSALEDRLSTGLEPRVTTNLAARLIANAKDNACVDSVAQQITMQHRRALPADGREH